MSRPFPTSCASPECENQSDCLVCPEPEKSRRGGKDRTKPFGRGNLSGRRLKLMFLQANPMCSRCGRPAVNVDYIMPKLQGGDDSWINLQSLCLECYNIIQAKKQSANESWGMQVK